MEVAWIKDEDGWRILGFSCGCIIVREKNSPICHVMYCPQCWKSAQDRPMTQAQIELRSKFIGYYAAKKWQESWRNFERISFIEATMKE